MIFLMGTFLVILENEYIRALAQSLKSVGTNIFFIYMKKQSKSFYEFPGFQSKNG